MKFKEVAQQIKRERKYQRKRWGVRPLGKNKFRDIAKPVESYLVYMQRFLGKAVERISTENGADGALEEIRKVVALGFACLEQNGCPERDLTNVVNARES